ncbi:hypothetical protein BKA67DRAFT_571282 [Truncatella angustata]|uniref:Uncharacterized protein n=1 Tax=Truncatella angustata TaxID=152316 RepID=A0A9P8ZV03_9PEZI|nr:uncharacterized protein BKA67DRAFT_571282 [Truncatella angustata]KAH6651586.1 hypothetical protein BKA67DRAFT_571282 [Truncatella angustata]
MMTSCKLESLHTDVTILILSAVTSLEDLSALIRASPILYRTFLLAKTSILANISYGDLGPAIRDALILVHTERQPFSSGDRNVYNKRVEETVANWRTRLLSSKEDWLRGASEAEAEHLVRINRTVQYFVDLYARVRFTYFERELGSKAGCWGLSITERQQLAQAFIRCQVILNLYCAPGLPPFDQGFLVTRVLALFEAWEMEQISQADTFAYTMCSALVHCENTEAGVPPTPAWWDATRRALREAAPIAGAVQDGPIPRGRYYKDYYPKLWSLRRKIIESTSHDPDLMDRILHWRDVTNGKMAYTPYKFLHNSHQFQSEYQTRRPPPPSIPCNLASQTPTHPPWGWVEAMAGHIGDRWGRDLLPSPPNGTAAEIWHATQQKFEKWRWAGFVFWDMDRAVIVKEKGLLGENVGAGWLVAPWG